VKFGLHAGQNVNLLVNTANGDVDTQTFVIRGIFSTKTPSFDQATVFMPLTKAQAITKAGDHASSIFILLKDRDHTNAVISALKTSGYQIKTWEEMNNILIQTEMLSNQYMGMLYFIVLIITATVIVNTLIMSVFERTREIGILSAMGMKAWRIMAMFFAESSLLAVGGIVMGLLLGGALVGYASYQGFYIAKLASAYNGMLLGEMVYAKLSLTDAVNLTVMAFVITLLAALYPALVAARMEPVEALRGGK
jgi:ABC-type lipoprotein release transport system permease subunit